MWWVDVVEGWSEWASGMMDTMEGTCDEKGGRF
jgi:hypothetical protein